MLFVIEVVAEIEPEPLILFVTEGDTEDDSEPLNVIELLVLTDPETEFEDDLVLVTELV